MPQVFFNRKNCIGCGNCADVLASYWDMDSKDGLATLTGAEKRGNNYILEIDAGLKDDFLEVAELCPVNVIKLR